MSMAAEVRRIARKVEGDGRILQAEDLVESSKDAVAYPLLNEYFWPKDTTLLLTEARLQRARMLIVRLEITSLEGDRVRLMTHVPGVPGYVRTEQAASNVDLAQIKLRQLARDLQSAKARFAAFRRMIDPEIAAELEEMIEKAASMAEHAATIEIAPAVL